MSGTPLVRPGGQPQLDFGAAHRSQPTTTRTTPDSGLGADDQMRHQERRVPPPGFVQSHPPPQYLPQDGQVMNSHHQSGSGVFGQPCDGNFDKDKITYEGASTFSRGVRYEADSQMMGSESVFNRGQPMMSNQSHSARYEDSNPSRMALPPTSMSTHQGNTSTSNSYQHMAGYYGLGGGGGIGTMTMQRPPIPSMYEADVVQSQQQLHAHHMQQTMPHYYSPNQPPPNSLNYQQVQSLNGNSAYSGPALQQDAPQPPPQALNQPPQAVVAIQQRGGQFIMPMPNPQMVPPQYVGQHVVPAGMHYPPGGMYMQPRPAVFVPRADVGYAPVEPTQPVMVPMPFVVHHMPPNQSGDQQQAPYQQGVDQQPSITMEQFSEQEFGPAVTPAQPVRPMSMPPGLHGGMQPMLGMMPQPPQHALHDSRSATSSIPPLVAPSAAYGPTSHPRMYGFPPNAMAPPFVMTPHFGVPQAAMMHSSPSRVRNSRTSSSFRGNSSFQGRNKQGSSPQTFSRQSSIIETPKDETRAAEIIAAVSAEVEKLSLKAVEATRVEADFVEQAEEEVKNDPVVEAEEQEEVKTAEIAEKATTPPSEANQVAPSVEVPREVSPPSASKAEPEKRPAVPIVAVAPVMSVKAEIVQAKEKELNEDSKLEKENLELRIKDAQPVANVQPLPAPDSSTAPVKLDCTFCRNLGMPEEVATSHVIRTKDGKVTCPELRKRSCSLCGATGENSHSAFFCPLKSQQTNEPTKEAPRIAHTVPQRPPSTYNKQVNSERRGGYRGGFSGHGHRGGGYNQGRGGGRFQSGNRRCN